MQPMANLALRAAREAGKHIARAYDRPDLVKTNEKGKNDYVTNMDRQAERVIIELLREKYPDHKYTGEEDTYEPEHNKPSDFEWVIDPIDGTANFVHGIPHFCVSIACLYKGKLEHGVILDPIRQEEFVASRGHGCSFNGQRVRIRGSKDLDGAMLATSGGGWGQKSAAQSAVCAELMEQDAITRQGGSAALDLAYVAAGKLDGMWINGLSLWDMAAGVLMVLEAGGLAGDFSGGANHLRTGELVAAGPKVFKALTPVVKRHLG